MEDILEAFEQRLKFYNAAIFGPQSSRMPKNLLSAVIDARELGIFQVSKNLNNILKCKSLLLFGVSWQLGNGKDTRL